MKLFALPVSLALALIGMQVLSTQPAEARGRKHHMRDRARQQAFYFNAGRSGGYGAACNMPMNSAYGPASLPPGIARQVYGNPNAHYGSYNGYGYSNPGFFRGLLGY